MSDCRSYRLNYVKAHTFICSDFSEGWREVAFFIRDNFSNTSRECLHYISHDFVDGDYVFTVFYETA